MITTNLFRESYAVLIDSEGRVVAIINCPAKGDITKQIENAIAEDKVLEEGSDAVTLDDGVLAGVDALTFAASYVEGGETYTDEFSLTTATVY